MKIAIIFDFILKEIEKVNSTGGPLFGRIIDEDELCQILSMDEASRYNPIGFWMRGDSFEEALDILQHKNLDTHITIENNKLVIFLLLKDKTYEVECYARYPGNHLEIIPLQIQSLQNILNRASGLLDIDVIRNKKVLIVGLGSGGSRVAVELAKCGVGFIGLIDHERLEIDNIMRHICGLNDVGRYKTSAVKDIIKNHNPSVVLERYELDVLESIDQYRELILQSDLIIEATGSPAVSSLTNQLCVDNQVPAVYAGVWENASGGYVMRYIPTITPCFNCVYEFLLKVSPPKNGKKIDYSIVNDLNELKSEPGLSIDIGFITLLHSKMALYTLLQKEELLNDIPQHLLIWLNKGYGDYKSLSILKADIKKRDDCFVCNPDGWKKKIETDKKH